MWMIIIFLPIRDIFYAPDTGKNWVNGTNTAKSNTANHYAQAVGFLNNARRQQAMEQLGRALHYLQDINEPHHASNIITTSKTTHSSFEAFVTPLVDDLIELYEAPEDGNFYEEYLNRSVSDSAHDAAVSAKRFVGLATNDSANKEEVWKVAALFTVAGFISCTAMLIYRFVRETHLV